MSAVAGSASSAFSSIAARLRFRRRKGSSAPFARVDCERRDGFREAARARCELNTNQIKSIRLVTLLHAVRARANARKRRRRGRRRFQRPSRRERRCEGANALGNTARKTEARARRNRNDSSD